MKKSELKEMVKEEVDNFLNEDVNSLVRLLEKDGISTVLDDLADACLKMAKQYPGNKKFYIGCSQLIQRLSKDLHWVSNTK